MKPYICKIPSVNGSTTFSTTAAPTKQSPTSTAAMGPCPNGWEFLQFSAKCVKVELIYFSYNFPYLKFILKGDSWLNHMVNCNRLGGNLISITSESSNAEIACKGPLYAIPV